MNKNITSERPMPQLFALVAFYVKKTPTKVRNTMEPHVRIIFLFNNNLSTRF